MNIIFLDVDGVLNSMAYFKWLKESGNALRKNEEYNDISDFHLQMLAKIYHTCDAHIVLTSTWRELDDKSDMNCYPMYQYLIDSLEKYGMKIMSKTPVIGMNRPLEIVTWLNNRVDKNEIKFVSLDDDYPPEVNGLCAMKLAARYKRPTILARLNEQGYDRGSIRNVSDCEIGRAHV